jgi:hypothetical protein
VLDLESAPMAVVWSPTKCAPNPITVDEGFTVVAPSPTIVVPGLFVRVPGPITTLL